jgi:hypothetical protein
MKFRRGPKAAGELLDELESDPEWVARRDARNLEVEQGELAFRLEQRALAHDLRAVGIDAESAWDLVNRPNNYTQALPTLLDHLKRDYSDVVKEGIARALAVPEAAPFWDDLVIEFKKGVSQNKPRTEEGLAVSLSGIVGSKKRTQKQINDALEFISDRRYGPSRLHLLVTFRRRKNELPDSLIAKLRLDPELSREIARWDKNAKKS